MPQESYGPIHLRASGEQAQTPMDLVVQRILRAEHIHQTVIVVRRTDLGRSGPHCAEWERQPYRRRRVMGD